MPNSLLNCRYMCVKPDRARKLIICLHWPDSGTLQAFVHSFLHACCQSESSSQGHVEALNSSCTDQSMSVFLLHIQLTDFMRRLLYHLLQAETNQSKPCPERRERMEQPPTQHGVNMDNDSDTSCCSVVTAASGDILSIIISAFGSVCCLLPVSMRIPEHVLF